MVRSRSVALLAPHGAGTERTPGRARLLRTSFVALGIAFGDIGTSPLYAMRESFRGHGLVPTHANVLGVLSLIAWALIVVVSLKYLVLLLRADNQGEGGILALSALASRALAGGGQRLVALLGLVGAALLYGDGMVTPAISVLSAVEGLAVAAPASAPYAVPLTVAFLVALFAVQRRGTTSVGRVFGPVMLLWFLALGVLGAVQVAKEPLVLGALDPRHAAAFLAHHGFAGLLVNYWGQGALLYDDPTASVSPFFLLAPAWALVPLVALATAAALIASQALISGAFSLTRQAVQLGLVPRLTVRHTSGTEIG